MKPHKDALSIPNTQVWWTWWSLLKTGKAQPGEKRRNENNRRWCASQPREPYESSADRSSWSSLVSKAVAAFRWERNFRLANAKVKRLRGFLITSAKSSNHSSDICWHLHASTIGLQSHRRGHCWLHRIIIFSRWTTTISTQAQRITPGYGGLCCQLEREIWRLQCGFHSVYQ